MSESIFPTLLKRISEEFERITVLNDELSGEIARLRLNSFSPSREQDVGHTGTNRTQDSNKASYNSSFICASNVSSSLHLSEPPRSPRLKAGKQRTLTDPTITSPNKRASNPIPHYLQLWPAWVDEDATKVFKSMTKSHMTNKMRTCTNMSMSGIESDLTETSHYRAGDIVTQSNSFLQRFVMKPNSMPHAFWDLCSAACLCYDIVVIPLHACTPFPENDFMIVMGWLMACFWTVDIPVSFFTGYRQESLIEMRPAKVARHYLRTWFAIDFPLVIMNWVFLLLGTTSRAIVGSARLSKFTRLIRVVRTIRLIRLGKVITSLTEFTYLLWTQDLLAVLGIFKMLLSILVLNHYIACVWYAMGDLGREDQTTWLTVFVKKYHDPEFSFRYTTALHWSITQFTPASMEVIPTNTQERVFAVSVIIFALVIFSSALAKITSTITSLREYHNEQNRRLDSMLQFFHANKLSNDLGSRIYHFVVRYQKKNSNRVLEGDVTAFQVLPNSMLMEMHFEVFAPIILRHPFFAICESDAHDLVFNLCHHAATESHLKSGEEVFVAGNHATRMYFIVGGSLDYQHYTTSGKIETLPVCTGVVCCEPVLWVQWTHKGRLTAESLSDLVAVDAGTFCSTVASHEDVFMFGQACARLCQENLLATMKTNIGLSDLLFDLDAVKHLVHHAFDNVQKEMRRLDDEETMLSMHESVEESIEEI